MSWDLRQALFSYLAAYAFVASVATGALTLALIGRLTGARWYDEAARRPTEALVATIPLLSVLFLPVALGLTWLYPWAGNAPASRAAFLNPGFFLVRSAFYLAIWSILAVLLPRAPRRVGAVGLPLVALTTTFASFDWTMSLEPEWSSGAYGVYVWSGGFLAALALAVFFGRPHEALAKLLLTASIFWAYIAYSQAVIIWIAGIPRENDWYVLRTRGAWGVVLGLVVLLKFLVPFLALLSYNAKRAARVPLVASASVLLGHAIDMHWLVLPALHARFAPSLLDLAALVLVGGSVLVVAASERESALA